MTSTTQESMGKGRRRMAREPKPQQEALGGDEVRGAATGEQAKPASTPKRPSKNEAVLALLKRPEGATLAQMVEATGWLPHTTRAVLTGFKKKGHSITSVKVDGIRVYRVFTAAGPV